MRIYYTVLKNCIEHIEDCIWCIILQTNRTQISYDALSEQQRYEIKQQVRQYIEGTLEEIDVSKITEKE